MCGAFLRDSFLSKQNKIAVFVVFITELHRAPRSSAGAGPPPLCSGGVFAVALFYPIRGFLIYFAILFCTGCFAVVCLPFRDFLINFAIFSFFGDLQSWFFFRPKSLSAVTYSFCDAKKPQENRRKPRAQSIILHKRKKTQISTLCFFAFVRYDWLSPWFSGFFF